MTKTYILDHKKPFLMLLQSFSDGDNLSPFRATITLEEAEKYREVLGDVKHRVSIEWDTKQNKPFVKSYYE